VSAPCGRQIRSIFCASLVTVSESETLRRLGRPQRYHKHHRNEKCLAAKDKDGRMEQKRGKARERIEAFEGGHRQLQMSVSSRVDNGTQLLLSFELQLSVFCWQCLRVHVVTGCVEHRAVKL